MATPRPAHKVNGHHTGRQAEARKSCDKPAADQAIYQRPARHPAGDRAAAAYLVLGAVGVLVVAVFLMAGAAAHWRDVLAMVGAGR